MDSVLRPSLVTYGQKWPNRYTLARSTKSGTCIVNVNTNILVGYPFVKVKVRLRSKRSK